MTPDRLGGVQSGTPQMRAVFDLLRAIAPLHEGVLLRGELGSGRQTLARALHDLARPNQPFVVVDVASIASQLLESVLFGHEYSTFTGAQVVKRGVFETAASGTVLLHEVAAIPYDLQPKLLRVIERREFRRVASSPMRPFTGRIVSTTHCELDELVAAHSFDGALRAALARDAEVAIPPLRARVADLPSLLAGLALDATSIARLSRLSWPGNLRQLEAFVRTIGHGVPPVDAVTELELLEAIEESPDDDSSRLVLGDLLARRGDPRGELIQVQCRLAQNRDDRKIRAAERKLLEGHHKTWERSVLDVASTPALASQVTFERGFADAITIEADALRRFDAVVRVAPLVTEVHVRGELGSNTWISPLLRRLRTLDVQVPTLGAPAVGDLARCRYLTGVRSLGLTSGHVVAAHDDPELRAVGIEALATSPHLAGVTTLALRQYELSADNLATLLGDRALWHLSELVLIGAALGPAEITALVAAPRAGQLQTLRLDPLDDAARTILLASPELRGVTLLDESQQMIRPGG